ncbi:hypothetical protein NliqN6_2886 [Naganishia liquefaciens]|uniref:IMS import disulfide relay-system CHCH-CHCH-like Cx9C domain-containing protein n=1 Tax=Naganishia liquefaciens TaxID=104408 RepID=A0A8H3YEH6_9TREE|nr:hypothetical protein NliqN6_2886 [Naganishia liquefaciens]
MDLSYNVVASKCAEQLAAYQQCVLKNQDGDWSNICRKESNDLTVCADNSVPHLPLLKRECYTQIQTYSSCLGSASQDKLSDEQTQERCSGTLSELWNCCERVFAMADSQGKSS